jgi:hypothetical protein
VAIRLEAGPLDPRLQGIRDGRRDLELDRALGLVLQDDAARCNLIPATNLSDLQGDQIAATQLAVDAQGEGCELEHTVLHDGLPPSWRPRKVGRPPFGTLALGQP